MTPIDAAWTFFAGVVAAAMWLAIDSITEALFPMAASVLY